ncbi:hypothetical protein JCM9279_006307 [Rhodotorula babjevae]
MASADPSADDFSDYYLDPPTEDQLDELEAQRARALEHPLKPGDSLSWQGPNLHPESLPPADYPGETPLPSPHEPRPLLSAFLARDSPGSGASVWSVRLLEGIQTGADKWAQVWRGEAVDEQVRTVGRVVLLYQQALFPFPDEELPSNAEHDCFWWWPARHAEACESRAYHDLSAYQGRDVPLCYGFYKFCLPDGEEVVGVVLEDLVGEVVPFTKLVAEPESAQRRTYAQVGALAFAAFELHRRVNESGIITAANGVEDLHQLKGSSPVERDRAKGPLAPWADRFCGLYNSESTVVSTARDLFAAMGHDYFEWREEKATQERLSFLETEL